MENLNHDTIELAFIVVTGLSVLVQTIVLLAIFITMRKAANSVKEEVEGLRASVAPVIADTKQVIARLTPKLESTVRDVSGVAADLKEISLGLKEQAKKVEASTEQILQNLHRQTGRVDSMITSALNGVDKASDFVVSAVSKPVRQASAILAGAKAVVEALRDSRHSGRRAYVSDETEPFV